MKWATIRCSRKRIWVKREFVWLLFYNRRNEKVTGGENRRKWKTEQAKQLEYGGRGEPGISWFPSSGLQGKKNSRWVTGGVTECRGALPTLGPERNAGGDAVTPNVGQVFLHRDRREEQCWPLKACQAAHSGHNLGVQGQQMMRLKNYSEAYGKGAFDQNSPGVSECWAVHLPAPMMGAQDIGIKRLLLAFQTEGTWPRGRKSWVTKLMSQRCELKLWI